MFLCADRADLFFGNERLDRYLSRSGDGWVLRLRELLKELGTWHSAQLSSPTTVQPRTAQVPPRTQKSMYNRFRARAKSELQEKAAD